MEQKNLLKSSLIISLIGILFLLLVSNINQPKIKNISDINSNQINREVMIKGRITNIKNIQENRFLILTIQDSTGQIDVTLSYSKKPNLKINQNITIIGNVQQYKSDLQINVQKIFRQKTLKR